MKQAVSPAKSALQYGILFGVIMILEFVVSYIIDIDPVTNKGFGIGINLLNFLIIPVILIVLGCNNYKNNINSGYISLAESLKIGVVICVLAGLIYAIFTSVFSFIFPEFIEDVLRKTKNVMIAQNPNMPEEQIEMALTWTEKFMQPSIAIPFTSAMYAFLGLILSLIIGAIIKKERPESL